MIETTLVALQLHPTGQFCCSYAVLVARIKSHDRWKAVTSRFAVSIRLTFARSERGLQWSSR